MTVRILTLFDDDPQVPAPAPARAKRAVRSNEPEPVAADENGEAVVSAAKEKPVRRKRPVAAFIPGTPIPEKQYYTIGETAAIFGVRTSHIRFWTLEFALKVRTTRKGDRLFTPENIALLRTIHYLVKQQGFTIAGARARLKEMKNEPLPEATVNPQPASTESTDKTILNDALQALRQRLNQLRNQLASL
jgi:DNA-binding transcriptional MerR regulator